MSAIASARAVISAAVRRPSEICAPTANKVACTSSLATARVADGALANLGQHLDQLRDHRFCNQRNNLVLAVEIKINGTGGDAGLERKLLDGRLMKRLTRQHPASSQKNLPPPRLDELVVLRRCA